MNRRYIMVVSFIIIAFVVVKLKVFKVLRTMAFFERFLGLYSPKYDVILPEFSPEVVL